MQKRVHKGADWILANDVGAGSAVLGGESNRVHLVTETGAEAWPEMSKIEVARRLATRITAFFGKEAA